MSNEVRDAGIIIIYNTIRSKFTEELVDVTERAYNEVGRLVEAKQLHPNAFNDSVLSDMASLAEQSKIMGSRIRPVSKVVRQVIHEVASRDDRVIIEQGKFRGDEVLTVKYVDNGKEVRIGLGCLDQLGSKYHLDGKFQEVREFEEKPDFKAKFLTQNHNTKERARSKISHAPNNPSWDDSKLVRYSHNSESNETSEKWCALMEHTINDLGRDT